MTETIFETKEEESLLSRQTLVIAQFSFYQHHHTASIYTARTHQAALSAQHALVHLTVGADILAAPHQSLHHPEIERRKVSGGAGRRAASAGNTGAKFGHFVSNFARRGKVVAVEVYSSRRRDRVSEIDRVHFAFLRYSTTFSAANAPSAILSPTVLGAVAAPA